MRDHTHSAPAFHALALVATMRAALGASRQIGRRREGHDPSGQEPEADVRADLAALRADLGGYVVRLRLRAVMGTPDVPAAALAQAFEDRVLLDDTSQTLALVHQKLLSLYPAVAEETVEEARLVASQSARRAVAEEPDRGLGCFADRLADLADTLKETLF